MDNPTTSRRLRGAGLHAFITLLALLSFTHAAEPVIPTGHPPERYERIWKKSPFTVASVIEVKEDTSSFTDTLSLVGLLTIGGKPFVTIRSNDSQVDQIVEADKPNPAGLEIISFKNNVDPSQVEVVLKKGDSTGSLRFVINETAAAPVAEGQPAMTPPRIIQPRVNQNIPQPTTRQVIPRAQGPKMPSNINTPVFRRRPLTLPGPNRSGNTNQPNSGARRGNVIPPP